MKNASSIILTFKIPTLNFDIGRESNFQFLAVSCRLIISVVDLGSRTSKQIFLIIFLPQMEVDMFPET